MKEIAAASLTEQFKMHVPTALRAVLKVQPGDVLVFSEDNGRIIVHGAHSRVQRERIK